MDYRRYSLWAEWGVAAAVAGIHAWAFFWSSRIVVSGFPLGELIRDVQWMSGISLALAWTFLGPGRLSVRVMSVPVLAGMLFWIRNQERTPQELENLFVVALLGTSLSLLLVLIGLGLQVRKVPETRVEPPAQFSLRTMVLATTAIAAAIGLLEGLRPTISANRTFNSVVTSTALPTPVGIQIRQLILGASAAFTAIGSVWVVLQSGPLWLRASAGGLLVLTASLYLAHLTEDLGSGFPFFAMHFVIGFTAIALLSGITALPLRIMGYRLQASQA